MTQVTKDVRLSGGSEHSIEDAISTVLGRVAMTIEDIHSFEVVHLGGTVSDDGTPASYEVTLDIRFGVKDTAPTHG
jgi:flavin-binding protein dodecin